MKVVIAENPNPNPCLSQILEDVVLEDVVLEDVVPDLDPAVVPEEEGGPRHHPLQNRDNVQFVKKI
jgi:hypothetical protein